MTDKSPEIYDNDLNDVPEQVPEKNLSAVVSIAIALIAAIAIVLIWG